MSAQPFTVRTAQPGDAEAAAAIYAQGIEDRTATFRTEALPAARFVERIESQPFVVAELEGGVAGWAAAGGYDDGCIYGGVGEAAVYVERSSRGQGLGPALLEALCGRAADAGLYKLIALIFTTNESSVALFERAGFRRVGVHVRHGQLDGRWKDVLVMERSLPGHT